VARFEGKLKVLDKFS